MNAVFRVLADPLRRQLVDNLDVIGGRWGQRPDRLRVKFEISDLHIEADGTVGYSHSIQHVSGTDPKGQPIDVTWRDTAAYRKIGGNWLIVYEHGSVPVDMATGKPDWSSKP